MPSDSFFLFHIKYCIALHIHRHDIVAYALAAKECSAVLFLSGSGNHKGGPALVHIVCIAYASAEADKLGKQRVYAEHPYAK